MATVGLVVAVVVGTLLVNWAAHRGLVRSITVDVVGLRTVYTVEARGFGMRTSIIPEAGDALALHVGLVGMALLFGYACKQALLQIEATSAWLTEYRFFSSFPVFPFCMLGGIVVDAVCVRCCTVSPIDKATLDRICGCVRWVCARPCATP
jgi:glutamate:Na+ symporter, ESS family